MAGITAATALAVILARQKQSLEAGYLELAARLDEPYVGMYVPGVRSPTIQGDSLLIGEGESQVLFVFGTTWQYTLSSLPSWKAIAARVPDNSGVRVSGVSVDSLEVTRAYVEEHGLGFRVVTVTEPTTRALYHLHAVPQVLIMERGPGLGVIETDLAVDSILGGARSAIHS